MVAGASALSFTDMPLDHTCYDAVSYIAQEQYVSGYAEDKTYRPDNILTKAQALKIIYAATEDELVQGTNLAYSDLNADHWVWPYVQSAATKGIIDWKEGASFQPEKTVNRAEFFKLAVEAFKIDLSQFSYDRAMADVPADAWFASYLNFAVNFDILGVSDSETNANPSMEVSRCDAANFIYRMLDRGNGLDAQTLLTLSEGHIRGASSFLAKDELDNSERYMQKANMFVDRALAMLPESTTVQGAVRINQSMSEMILAYRALQEKNYDVAIEKAKSSWTLAQQALELEKQQESFAKDIQKYSGAIADKARAYQAM